MSICSNVEDYTEPRWIIDSEVDSLIGQMVDYMTQIGHKSYQLALDKFAAVFEALDNDIQHVNGALAFRRRDGRRGMVGRTKKDAKPSRGTQERTGRVLSKTNMTGFQFGQIRLQSGEIIHSQTLGHARRTQSVHHQEKQPIRLSE